MICVREVVTMWDLAKVPAYRREAHLRMKFEALQADAPMGQVVCWREDGSVTRWVFTVQLPTVLPIAGSAL